MTTALHWLSSHWLWPFGHLLVTSAVAGSLAGIYAMGLYVIGIFQHLVQPHRTTWFVFAVGSSGGAWFTYKAAGLTASLGVITLAVLVNLIWLVSLWPGFGHKGLEKWYHPYFATGALLVYGAQLSWHWPPVIAVIAAIVVDSTAIQIQWKKTREEPESEELPPWVWGTIGGILTTIPAIAVGTFTSWGFPVYFVITNAVVVYYLVKARLQQQNGTLNPAGGS